jgi:hypothetical protein
MYKHLVTNLLSLSFSHLTRAIIPNIWDDGSFFSNKKPASLEKGGASV